MARKRHRKPAAPGWMRAIDDHLISRLQVNRDHFLSDVGTFRLPGVCALLGGLFAGCFSTEYWPHGMIGGALLGSAFALQRFLLGHRNIRLRVCALPLMLTTFGILAWSMFKGMFLLLDR